MDVKEEMHYLGHVETAKPDAVDVDPALSRALMRKFDNISFLAIRNHQQQLLTPFQPRHRLQNSPGLFEGGPLGGMVLYLSM